LGDQKCIPRWRKSFVGHPSASSFLCEEVERVFQQPRLITICPHGIPGSSEVKSAGQNRKRQRSIQYGGNVIKHGRRSLASDASTLMLALSLAVVLLGTPVAAQTFSVIHYFTGGADGGFSTASLTMDRDGRLYGTTAGGGRYAGEYCPSGCGVVFRLVQAPAGWVVQPLYTFPGEDPAQGLSPYAPITFGPDGNIYGTTTYGGNPRCYAGCGRCFV
jgi:uncharacterized repeat protein (TIGR03803 family)